MRGMRDQNAKNLRRGSISLVIATAFLTACSLTAPDPVGEPQSVTVSATTTPPPSADLNTSSASIPPLSVEPIANLNVQTEQLTEQLAAAPQGSARDFAPINPAKLAFIWYDLPLLGLNSFVPTYVQLSKDGPMTLLSFVLPPANILCEGRISFNPNDPPDFNTGDWEIGCSNNQVLRGILVPVRGQNAINGQGVDLDGRSVIFSIDMNG